MKKTFNESMDAEMEKPVRLEATGAEQGTDEYKEHSTDEQGEPTGTDEHEEHSADQRTEKSGDWVSEEAGAVKEDEFREETKCSLSADGTDGKEPVVVIKGVQKAFKDHAVLKGVDLHVNKGENLVVLGKSGSGKSVLIKCLVGLETPDEGELCVFGHNIASLNYKELNETRVRIGFLFQNSALYDSMTVRENLAFPLRRHKKDMSKEKRDALIKEMLDNVGLPDVIDQMPSELSGGQNKRIGLARTLILRPELMLYDEPTTGLDTGTSKEISELIHSLQKKYNISSIMITHDMPSARITADRIIMMKEGVVHAEGTYAELEKSDDEWIKSFFA